MEEKALKTSVFLNEHDSDPLAHEGSWEQLAESLTDLEVTACTSADCARKECPHKSGTSWSPASWLETDTRKKHTVQEVSCFVVDLDHLQPSELEGYLDRFDHLSYILHASHSDRPTDRCVRLVFQTSRSILNAEFPRFWLAGVKFLDISADRVAKDSSRLYYLPSRPSDASHEAYDGTGFDFAIHDGQPLDVDQILATAPEILTEVSYSTEIPEFDGAPSQESLREAVEVLGKAWPASGQRHEAHLALSGALARAGWPVDLIGEFCADVAEIQEPGNGDLSKRLSAARSSVEKAQSGQYIKGWPSLAAFIGEDVVQEACESLGIGIGSGVEELAKQLTERYQAKRQQRIQEAQEQFEGGEQQVAEEIEQRSIAPRQSTAPTRLQVITDLELVRDFLKKSKDANRRHDGKLISKVLKGEYLTEHANEDRRKVLDQTAVAVARAVRPGTTVEQVVELLLPVSGYLAQDVPEIVRFAFQAAQTAGPIDVPGPRVANDTREPGEPEDDNEIRDQLELGQDGNVRNTGHNIERILRFSSALRGVLRFNVVTKQIEITGGRFEQETVGGLPVGVMNWLGSHWSLTTSTDKVAEQILRVAQTWCSYDPVAEYLDSLEWDGISRIGSKNVPSWLTTYCGVEDNAYVRKVGTRFLISAVARGLNPGCKVDTLLVIEGLQGTKKSTMYRVLGGDWFSDTPLVLGDKDSYMIAASKWIVELAELSSLARGEAVKHKAFLSAQVDNFRPPYGRAPEEFERHCVFGGTVNEAEYLEDPTGNRRYWAVTAIFCDIRSLNRDRDQIWAEAVFRYRSAELNPEEAIPDACPGERWWFEPFEQHEADAVIASRRGEDPWVEKIRRWADKTFKPGPGAAGPRIECTLVEVAEEALEMTPEATKRHSKHIMQALRDAGFDRVFVSVETGGKWVRRNSTSFGVPPKVATQTKDVSNSN